MLRVVSSNTPYDTVAYPSYCHRQTHPDRLASMAYLFGMTPAPVERCRVLELGCGDGSNLIPMAHALPDSTFVGMDLAASAIARGQEMVDGLSLKNIRLIAGSVTDITSELGQYDYILAHGLYSWVPQEVREHILRVCRENLAPSGVAFISYNAYPGGHARQMMRDMLLFHTRNVTDPTQRTQQAIGLLQLLKQGQEGVRDEFRTLVRASAESTLELQPGHIFHDELADVNQPFWFSEFISAAHQNGLQFLAEADLFEMTEKPFNESTRRVLSSIPDRLVREQYLDFLKCRRFRQTLLCHANRTLTDAPLPDALGRLFISSEARPCTPMDLDPTVAIRFEGSKDARLETDFAAGKAAMDILGQQWPRPIRFVELCELVRDALIEAGYAESYDDDTPASLRGFLMAACGAGLAELHAYSPGCIGQPGPRPEASALALWQLRRGNNLTSLRHLPMTVDDAPARHLLQMLDGSRTRDEILDSMVQFLVENGMPVAPGTSPEAVREKVAHEVDKQLQRLARIGLLVA